MYKRPKKTHKKIPGTWIGDDNDHNYTVHASVVLNGSSHATTSYTRYAHAEASQPLQMNDLGTMLMDHGTNVGMDSQSEPSKTQKQVCCSNLMHGITE